MNLGLGTVQFGLDYGVTNCSGQVSLAEAREIVSTAAAAGVEILDTAAAYGESETTLGQLREETAAFRIVTKLPSLSGIAEPEARESAWRDGLRDSLDRLRATRVDVLLAHSAADLLGPDGDRLWGLLEGFKAAGAAGRVGASVYEGAQIESLLSRYDIQVVQLPINAFDNRLARSGHLAGLKDRGVEIHARSVFLQGLLLTAPERLPQRFASLADPLAGWLEMLSARGLTSLQGALLAVRQRHEIDSLIFGVASLRQLEEILAAWQSIRDEAPIDLDSFALADDRLLDPRLWPAGSAEAS